MNSDSMIVIPPLIPSSPKASYAAHKNEINLAVQTVLESGWYILGQEVALFEEEFARFVGTEAAIGVASGTDALVVGLRACGIGARDHVITVSHTAVATVCAIQLVGATPVLVDIDKTTFTMDLNRVEDALRGDRRGQVRAIIPVHLYGHPVPMSGVMELADRYGLYVIEDCAQAHGAICCNRRVGSFGHFGAFSFYPTKNLGAIGDGGALVTKDQHLADSARLQRQYGWKQRYISESPGMNSRLDELQAAILRVKLRYLDENNRRRREIARAYDDLLVRADLSLPAEEQGMTHVYHQYVIRSHKRDALKAFLKENSIETAILYPQPIHLQPAYRDTAILAPGGLAETEKTCHEILSLPLYPELNDGEVSRVAKTVLQAGCA